MFLNVYGEDLTGLCREIWAMESDPVKALNILDSAFPDMSEGERVDILTGRKKLVGDATGMTLEDDDVSEYCGAQLDLKSVLTRHRNALQAEIDSLRDLLDLERGDVVSVPSPKGLVFVSARRESDLREGKITIDQVVYREAKSMTAKDRRRWYMGDYLDDLRFLDLEIKADPEYDIPGNPVSDVLGTTFTVPKAEYHITTDSGWLSPDGKFYPAGVMEHDPLAEELGGGPVKLENEGWVRITSPSHLGYVILQHTHKDGITQQQLNMIWDRWPEFRINEEAFDGPMYVRIPQREST